MPCFILGRPLRFFFFPTPDVDLSQNKDSTGDEKLTAKALGEYYTKLAQDFPIVSIEDGFDQVRAFGHVFVCVVTALEWSLFRVLI